MYAVVTVFIWFIFYSAVGWLYESTVCSVAGRKFVNRGFLNGPLCPIYGCGALLVLFLLKNLAGANPLFLFLSSAVITCTLEYVTSFLMEKLFHARWWDYSGRKFNLNGRVCLLGAVVFGVLSVALVKWIHPSLQTVVYRIPAGILYAVAVVLAILFVADAVCTIMAAVQMNQKLTKVEAALHLLQEKTRQNMQVAAMQVQKRVGLEEIRAEEFMISLRVRLIERRLLRAFPKMKSARHADALRVLKENLRGHGEK